MAGSVMETYKKPMGKDEKIVKFFCYAVVTSVSYTHLDVYKRQEFAPAII